MIEAIVAVPVRDEEERIGACLEALAVQTGIQPGTLGIVLLVNNTTDGTIGAIDAARSGFPHELRIVTRDAAEAHAGWARRAAMEIGAEWLESTQEGGGVLLTTDADSRVAPDWVARNLAAVAAGADAVAGTIQLDPVDAGRLSPALEARGRLEAEYHALLDEVAARIDPDPADPWPNHTVESGASLAATLKAYRAVGGMPPVALGDDRAFAARLRAHGFTIRHDPAIHVVTSGRLAGRAAGGVADTMRARQDDPDCPCDARLEPFPQALLRLRWRRRLRRRHEPDGLTTDDGQHRTPPILVDEADQASARLPSAPLRPGELAAQIDCARDYLRRRAAREALDRY